jgi:hypothetical protein
MTEMRTRACARLQHHPPPAPHAAPAGTSRHRLPNITFAYDGLMRAAPDLRAAEGKSVLRGNRVRAVNRANTTRSLDLLHTS